MSSLRLLRLQSGLESMPLTRTRIMKSYGGELLAREGLTPLQWRRNQRLLYFNAQLIPRSPLRSSLPTSLVAEIPSTLKYSTQTRYVDVSCRRLLSELPFKGRVYESEVLFSVDLSWSTNLRGRKNCPSGNVRWWNREDYTTASTISYTM